MIARINGEDMDIACGVSVEAFLAQRKMSEKSVVVEYNRRILEQREWPHVILKDNDSLEIISFVGGG